ncbi:hypothetical protein BDQ17DRAFT_177739 [Cyathus striatus]|nr:hypothetical protein BDQ17DRAFT_177739 [Cyathus striatus]
MRHAYFSRVDWGKVRRKLLQVPHFKRIGLKIACKPRSSSAASPSSKPRSLNSLLLDGHQRPRLELKRSRPMLTVDTDVRKSKDHIPKPAEGGEEWGTNTEHVRNAGEKMDVNTPPASTLDVRPTTPEIVARYIVAQSQGQPVPEIFSPSTSHVQSHDEEPLTIEDEELGETPKQDSDIVHYIDGRLDEVRPRTRVCENEEMDDDKVAQGAGILDNNNSENSLEHRSTLPCTPEARERIPHERFWEMLDEEEAVNSSRTTSSHLHFSPTRRRPRKLQKPRSSAVFTLQQPQFLKPPTSDDLSQGNSIGLRRCKSTSALHPEYSEPVSGLPDGIEQVGMGIGYTQPGSHTSKSLALGCTTMNCYSVIRGSLQKIGVRLGGAQSASGYDETKEYQLHENKPPTEQLQLRHSMIQNTSTEGVVNACSGASDSRGAAIGFAKFL